LLGRAQGGRHSSPHGLPTMYQCTRAHPLIGGQDEGLVHPYTRAAVSLYGGPGERLVPPHTSSVSTSVYRGKVKSLVPPYTCGSVSLSFSLCPCTAVCRDCWAGPHLSMCEWRGPGGGRPRTRISAACWRAPTRRPSTSSRAGAYTLHFSAQLERFLWHRGCI